MVVVVTQAGCARRAPHQLHSPPARPATSGPRFACERASLGRPDAAVPGPVRAPRLAHLVVKSVAAGPATGVPGLPGAFPISRSSAVCRQRWTVRLGEVEPVFGQTGRVVLDTTARTAHDGALKWTRTPSTPRAARSILATFPSTCALPSGGRWSLRRVLQRPGRQRKRSSAKSSCGPSRTSSSAPSSPPCCNARCAPPRLATRRAPSCATCPGGCGATAWRPSTFAPPGARRCRSPRRTTARNTPVGRSGGRDSTRTLPRLGGAGHLRPVHAEAGLGCKPRGRHAQLAGRSAGAAPLRRHRPGYQDPPLDRLSLRCAGRPERPSRARRAVCWTA